MESLARGGDSLFGMSVRVFNYYPVCTVYTVLPTRDAAVDNFAAAAAGAMEIPRFQST